MSRCCNGSCSAPFLALLLLVLAQLGYVPACSGVLPNLRSVEERTSEATLFLARDEDPPMLGVTLVRLERGPSPARRED